MARKKPAKRGLTWGELKELLAEVPDDAEIRINALPLTVVEEQAGMVWLYDAEAFDTIKMGPPLVREINMAKAKRMVEE